MQVDFWKDYQLYSSLFIEGHPTSIARIRHKDLVIMDDVTGIKIPTKASNLEEAKLIAVDILSERYKKLNEFFNTIL